MDIEILDWTSDLDRPSAIDALDTADLPVCHTVSVTERRISIDDRTIIQNNVRTDTLSLNLDGEWDGANVVVLIGKTGSEVELEWKGEPVVIPAQVAENVGAIDVSVVGYSSDGTVRLVTAEAAGAMTVIRSGALTGEVPAEEAPDVLAQLLESAADARRAATEADEAAATAHSAADRVDEAIDTATSAAESATAATAKATEAASAANEAANTANGIIAQLPLPDGNVPRATRRGEVVSVDDAFSAVPLGLKVYGRTRQNLWVNPSGTKNGGTVTSNEDGSITLSGTLTGSSAFYLDMYNLKPGATYTASVDKAVNGSTSRDVMLIVEDWNDSEFLENHCFGYGSALTRTFTFNASANRARFTLIFTTSAEFPLELSGTYRVMLNEGDTAEPWCPPGLTSAEPTQVVVAGKNLLTSDGMRSSGTINGIEFTNHGDGSFSAVGTATATTRIALANNAELQRAIVAGETYVMSLKNATYDNSKCNISAGFGNGRFLVANKTPFKCVDSDKGVSASVQLYIPGGTAIDLRNVSVQLELGSTATAYEPPNVTTLTLDPVELRNLPDGTADVLDVGSGSVEGNVYTFEPPFSLTDTSVGDAFALLPLEAAKIGGYSSNVMSNVLRESGNVQVINMPEYSYKKSSDTTVATKGVVYVKLASGGTSEQMKSWLDSNGAEFMVEAETPTTSTLTPVALPTLPSPVCNVWAVSDVPCEVEMEYVRDVNVVLAKLEGAM